ncbi:MAG: NADH-quinone oxidoreductase subunit N [Chloroflexi bacterium]|nr:NADH-quinone oxidoreductase subunit N [Chloroflexota bacterium]
MDFFLLSPEISLAALAVAVVLLDLIVQRRGWVLGLSVVGLLIPAGFSLALWGQRATSFRDILVVDELSVFIKLLLLGIAALVLLSSGEYLQRRGRPLGEFCGLVLFATMGMSLLASSRELITIYVSLELTSLSLYALAGYLRDARSSEAGLKYLVFGAISSALLLYGIALVFGLTGTTYLSDILARLAPIRLFDSPALLVGLVLMTAGFGFKIATVPFQMWLPDVFEGAPIPVVAFVSAASKAAGFAVVLRVFYEAFGNYSPDWSGVFAVLAAFSMTVGNLAAIAQSNIRRMLGYSTIAHVGYIMVGLATVSALGRSGLLFFLAAYSLANLAAFFTIVAISSRVGSDLIQDYAGMARRAPVLALVLAFALVSLIGIPPTGGFWAKVYIFNAAVRQDLVWLVMLGLINSVISAYYYLRVVKVMYLDVAPSPEGILSPAPVRAALLLSAVGVLVLGLLPAPLLRLAETAARVFIP